MGSGLLLSSVLSSIELVNRGLELRQTARRRGWIRKVIRAFLRKRPKDSAGVEFTHKRRPCSISASMAFAPH